MAALALARGDGRYAKLLRSLARVNLLILDDWGPEPLGPPSVSRSDAAAAAPVELPAVSPAEPASAHAMADNPLKPPESQPKPQPSQQPVVTTDQTPPVVDDKELVDPAARELITRGWALYHLPYTPVRWQEARRDFEQALELDSRSSEARIGLASILSTKLADGWSPVLQEDMPRAEHLLLEAIDKGGVSNRAAAHFTLGVLRQMQNRLPEAQSEFETAISLDPNNARTYLHLGETLLYLGQPEAGIPPLEQAIRLRPDDPNLAITYWALGTCQLLLGRVDQAIDLLQTARAANSRLWVPYFYLAGAYGLKGDLDRARSALGESLRLEAGHAIHRPDASRESVAQQSAILGVAGKNAEPRIAAGRISRSVIVAVSDNSLSVLFW